MGYGSRDYFRPAGFGGFSFFPPVIKNLLIINGIVFFIQIIFDNLKFGQYPGWYILNQYFALNPISGSYQGIEYNFQIWQLITYQFMHGGFFHILFNMFMLWMFGMEIENMWGSKKFLFFYLLCGIGAGLAQVLLAPLFSQSIGWTIGASGAVFGVMIAFAMFFPDRYIYLYFLIPVKAKYLIGFLVIFEFLSVGNLSFVAHLAHIGGVITGLAFILIDRRKHINIEGMFDSFKDIFSGSSSGSSRRSGPKNTTTINFRKPSGFKSSKSKDVQDAEFYDIKDGEENTTVSQEEIDRILDKISQSGYQNLTDREKKILFEASKRG